MTRLFRALFAGRTLFSRLLRRFLAGVAVLIALSLVGRIIAIQREDRLLEAEIAALDLAEPEWRSVDILARLPIPDAENSVAVLVGAKALLPKEWYLVESEATALDGPPGSDLVPHIAAVSLDDALPPKVVRELGVARERSRAAREALRPILDLERGQHACELTPNPFWSEMPTIHEPRTLAAMMKFEAYLNIEENDPTAAIECVRTILRLSRSLDSPALDIPLLVRLSTLHQAIDILERLIHHSVVSEAGLLRVEAELAREEAELDEYLFRVLRNERAATFAGLQAVREGRVTLKELLDGKSTRDDGYWFLEMTQGPMVYRRSQTTVLQRMTEMIRTEGATYPQRADAFAESKARLDVLKREGEPHNLAVVLVPGFHIVLRAQQREVCLTRCARAGLLAEVFRLRNGRLPASVEELCTSLKVPILLDPWDDKPLKWKPDGEGVSVYSVGADGTDDGGKRHSKNYDEAGHDLVFRIPLSRNPQP